MGVKRIAAIVAATGLVSGIILWHQAEPSGNLAVFNRANAETSHSHASERAILYYRDPGGAPSWSAEPRKDAQGRDFIPVYDDQEISFEPEKKAPPQTAQGERKILYYRNPMGLPDTSPVPKKDSMGMDYIAVYAGEEPEDGAGIKISLGRVQRSGVRTEPVEARVLVRPVRAVGTVSVDERRQTIVTLRAEAFVEDLFVNTTGQLVRKGEPLFRIYSPQIQSAQTDFLVALGANQQRILGIDPESNLKGGMQRLRNLDVPDWRIEEVRRTRENPRTIDWPSPATGTILSKKVIKGQRVMPGDELYRIADLSTVWIIADVAESDLALLNVGTRAKITVRAYPNDPFEGQVTLVYPELKAETRTARVRIEVPNPDLRLKTEMYADVEFRTGGGDMPVVSVPDGAVIDDGRQQIVLVAKQEGRFEPRPVKLGRHGDGFREVVTGLTEGEEIVTTATFLIDAESNLRSALKSFTPPESQK